MNTKKETSTVKEDINHKSLQIILLEIDTFAATSPRFPEVAKWYWMTRNEGSLSPLAMACLNRNLI